MRRRTFLKGGALAAGAALLEGCAREEIAYLEQSVDRLPALKGVSVWRSSTCGQCPSGCGIVVRTVDGNAKKVEGIADHPINHGGLCALGQASLQGLYNPDRITKPLRATGARGTGDFEEIDWETALGLASSALAADRVAVLGGDSSDLTTALLRRFTAEIGALGPAFVRAPDAEVERLAATAVFGGTRGVAYDLERADYILSIGPAFLDRWRSPVYGIWALARSRRGVDGRRSKLVQAESRFSQTAATADEWLAVIPGREGLLARALAGLLLADARATAADRYNRLFPEPPPALDEAAEQCGVSAKQIKRIARELVSCHRPVVLAGGSAALHQDGIYSTAAALGLNLLIGAVNREGGIFEAADFGLSRDLASQPEISTTALLEGLGHGSTLLVVDADPLHTQPRQRGWQEAIDSADTVVALSSFMDDTTRRADLILPIQVDVERFNAGEAPAAVRPVLNLSRPTVRPRGDARHPGDVLLGLATALDRAQNLPWSSFSEMAQALAEAATDRLPGAGVGPFRPVWEQALDRGGFWNYDADPRPLAEGLEPLPQPGIPPPADGGFDLVLFESTKIGDGRGANRPWLQELPDTLSTVMWGSWIEVSTYDAERLGIRDSDVLELTSEHGVVEAPAITTPAARPGTVSVPLGLGHIDFGRYARGLGINPLDLLGPETIAGTTASRLGGTRVELRRIGPGRIAMFGRGLRDGEEIPTGWAPQPEPLNTDPEEEA